MKKKVLIFLLCFVLLFICACENTPSGTLEATLTPKPTSQITKEPYCKGTPLATAQATAKPTETPVSNDAVYNLVDEKNSTFEVDDFSELRWSAPYKGSCELSDNGYNGKGLKFLRDKAHSYSSFAIDIFPYIQGAGEHQVSLKIKFEGNLETVRNPIRSVFIRGGKKEDANSFIELQTNGNAYYKSQFKLEGEIGDWQELTLSFTVEEEDLDGSPHVWNLCCDAFVEAVEDIYVDNLIISTDDYSGGTIVVKGTPAPTNPTSAPDVSVEESENVIDAKNSAFEVDSVSDLKWITKYGGSYEITDDGYEGKGLRFLRKIEWAYSSFTMDIYPYIQTAGEYHVSFMIKFEGSTLTADSRQPIKSVLIRGGNKDDANSFIEIQSNGNPYCKTNFDLKGTIGQWQEISFDLIVEEEDLDNNAHQWFLCCDFFADFVESAVVDNVSIALQ